MSHVPNEWEQLVSDALLMLLAQLADVKRAILEDAIMDAVLYALTHPEKYDPSRALVAGWIYGIARRAYLRDRSRLQKERPLEVGDFGRPAPVVATAPESNPMSCALRNAIEALPHSQRTIIERDLAEPTGRAPSGVVAREADVAAKSVPALRCRAKRRLKRDLRVLFDESGQ